MTVRKSLAAQALYLEALPNTYHDVVICRFFDSWLDSESKPPTPPGSGITSGFRITVEWERRTSTLRVSSIPPTGTCDLSTVTRAGCGEPIGRRTITGAPLTIPHRRKRARPG
jgi:hypothetical protein